MSELRWNPLLGTWTVVAANRQNRPNMPKDFCPFCPGEGKSLPDNYDVWVFPNDFPALSDGVDGEWSHEEDKDLWKSASAKGSCEVILYSSDHDKQLHELSDKHLYKLMLLWKERFEFYKTRSIIKYVYEFENRGADVGVTMPHPHGQLYAFPFIPLKILTELENCKKYFQQKSVNLFDTIIEKEISENQRVIFETSTFLVFLPYFTDYPYGVFIVSKIPVVWINEFDESQLEELGVVIKQVNGMFDELFQTPFPYMMCMHQGAIHDKTWDEQHDFYRFHIEFYPPWRAPHTIKYYASAETGAWAATNTKRVEDTTVELKDALERYKSKNI